MRNFLYKQINRNNKLLKHTNKVAMTNRKTHSPSPDSNEQIYIFLEHFLAKNH